MTELDSTRFQACIKCSATKPLTTQFFNRHKAMASGFIRTCKVCESLYRRAYYKTNRDKACEDARRWRGENIEVVRAREAEYRKNNKAKKSEADRAWREANKERKAANDKAYREANAEKIAAYQKQYRAENAEEAAAYQKEYRAENAERLAAYAAEYQRRNSKRLSAEQKERAKQNWPHYLLRMRVAGARRRARLRNQTGQPYSVDDVLQMYEDQGGLCAYCEHPLFGGFEVDHMMPVSRGGLDGWDNLAIVCTPCNRRKNARTTEEFMALLDEGA